MILSTFQISLCFSRIKIGRGQYLTMILIILGSTTALFPRECGSFLNQWSLIGIIKPSRCKWKYEVVSFKCCYILGVVLICAIWNKDRQGWIPQQGKELEKHVCTKTTNSICQQRCLQRRSLQTQSLAYANAHICGSVHLPLIDQFFGKASQSLCYFFFH